MTPGAASKANSREPARAMPAHSNGVSKASRVADAIVSAIESGALREGDRLPSEEVLAAQHGVSVGTIQKVLGRLSNEGLIRREHGRGTFVSGRHVAPADV